LKAPRYKKKFVQKKDLRIELDPNTIISQQPQPQYTYGSSSNEHFPETFPTVRKEGGGVGTAASVSTPTFGGSEGEGKEIDFFKCKKKIYNIIEKSKIYIKPGEKPPKGVQVKRGPKGGLFYEGTLPGMKWEKKVVSSQEWERPSSNKTLGGLLIPNTWQKEFTFINRNKDAELQATGIDAKNRRVSLRSAEGHAAGKAQKNKRLKEFSHSLPKILKQLEKDAPNLEEAMICKIMSRTSFRIGSETETTGKVPSYGISTLLRKHVTVKGDKVKLDFPGKDGKKNDAVIVEPNLARRIEKIGNPNQRIFNAEYKDTLAYLRKISGADFKSHDFRSWIATSTAIEEIKKYQMPTNEKEFRKIQIAVGKKVSSILKNNYTVALKHYVSPDVWTPMEINLGKELTSVKKEFSYYNDIYDMLDRVYYGNSFEKEEVKSKINNLLEKARVYLGPNDTLPPGKKLQFGQRGGRYYDTELEVYRHLWERVKERKVREDNILRAINILDTKNLPSQAWWFRIKGGEFIVGKGNQLQTVLKPTMRPIGIEIESTE
jgi:DNA topoisomerase IB